MRRRLVGSVLAVVGAGGLVLGACGGGDGGNDAGVRTVDVDMHDISFSPGSVKVDGGETVRFVFHNKGKVRHDAFIGDESAQQAHEAEMGGEMHGMSHAGMTATGGITVEPGKTGELTHTFAAGDQLLIGCHEAGHYAAGMKVHLAVS